MVIRLGTIDIQLGREALFFICFAALLGCIGARCRYLAFSAYRVRYSLYHVAFHKDLTAGIGGTDNQKSAAGNPS